MTINSTLNYALLIDIAATLVSLLFFVIGSISDLKKREVEDTVWLAYGSLGAVLTAMRLLLDPSLLIVTSISVAVALLISIGLVVFGLTGGADSKAIICLALALPLPPSGWQPLVGFVHPFFPIVAVMMGFICAGFMALWYGIRNTVAYARSGSKMFKGFEHESNSRKIMAFVSGYPTRISNLKSKFYLYPIEELTRSGQRHFKFFIDVQTDHDQLVARFTKAMKRSKVKGMVWVTPGLPMLVFILAGLIIALVIGDPIFTTILRSAIH